MTDRPRFVLTLSIKDNFGEQRPLFWSISADQAMRISWRSVEELKLGILGSMDAAVEMMKTREVRRQVLVEFAKQAANQLCNTLEDAEGWHDPERIRPAREAIGGDWK